MDNNSYIFITGASGAIGSEISRSLVQRGHNVILSGRNEQKLSSLASQLKLLTPYKNKILISPMDLADDNDIKNKSIQLFSEFKISSVIHTAGTGEAGDLFTSSADNWSDCIESKLLGVVRVTKYMSLEMIKNHIRGNFIVINGSFCKDPNPDFITLSTINLALSGFIKASSKTLATHGININAINPWVTESPSWNRTSKQLALIKGVTFKQLNESIKDMNPSKRFAEPLDITNVVNFLLKEASNYINGSSIDIDGGASVGV